MNTISHINAIKCIYWSIFISPQNDFYIITNLQPVSNQYFIFSKSEIWSLSLMEHSKG